jgi:hypothetical protein
MKFKISDNFYYEKVYIPLGNMEIKIMIKKIAKT